MANRGAPPFERCDNTLQLVGKLGLGSRDLNQIEVLSPLVAEVRFNFGNGPAG